ncbi:MAG: FlgD immunoglobulin-like domain containing protein, partial [Rhodothermia bacterium]
MTAFERARTRLDLLVVIGLLGLTLHGTRAQAQDAVNYVSYLGGPGEDFGVGSHQLPNGDVIMVMQTGSSGLVTTGEAVKSELTGASDAYIIRFNPDAGEIIWASYFGGDLQDWVFGTDCDDEASTCGFTGAREISDGSTRAYAAIFRQDGTLVCSNLFSHGTGSTVGNHYDDPPEDEDFDGAGGSTLRDLEIGPVIFGSVHTAQGDLDAAIWMLDPQTCDARSVWTTGIPTDDTFFHGFMNPSREDDSSDTHISVHGFGALDGDANGVVANAGMLQCVWYRKSAGEWQFECEKRTTRGTGQTPEIYLEAAYDDEFGIVAGTYKPTTGTSAIVYWESSHWTDAIAAPTARFDLGAGLPRGISIEPTGLLSLTTWRFEGEDYAGIDIVKAFIRAPNEEGGEKVTILESTAVEGGPTVQLLPGNNPWLFTRSLAGYAGTGLTIPEGALQTDCEGLFPGSTCGLYVELDDVVNYTTGCNVSPTPAAWTFTSDPVTVSGQLQPATCTRLLPWGEERGFTFSLIDVAGDTTAFSSDDGLEDPFTLVLADLNVAALPVPDRPEHQRAHMFYFTNWLDYDVTIGLDSGTEASGRDTLRRGSGAWFSVTPGGQARVVVESEGGPEKIVDVTFPYRDFIQYAVIWPDRQSGKRENFNLAVFDDRGRLLGEAGFPPVASEPEAGYPAGMRLDQNYPNPFSGATAIRYALDQPGPAELSVYDLFGRRVRTLDSRNRSAGTHVITWDGHDGEGNPAAAGVYILRLETNAATLTR